MENSHFKGENAAKNYSSFRPSYPESLSKSILEFLDEKLPKDLPRKLELDVGCGSGQSVGCVAPFFEKVIGIDVSEDQILKGRENNVFKNVEYVVGTFKELPAEDNSVSLVICGTTIHWFNPIEEFYAEVKRVLVPGGCLAIFAYSKSFITGLPKPLNHHLNLFFTNVFNKIAYEAPKEIKILFDNYHNLEMPFEDVTKDNSVMMTKELTFDKFAGFYKTKTLYKAYKDKYHSDTLEENRTLLEEIQNDKHFSNDTTFEVTWPISTIYGRKCKG
ncbi:DgyrCDS14588 [Dimorphilus gyrociliatus]|uniref:DgyrCDS14588 n=1 Tax=Dimorphilus gyrociliatus TaxID=2664684 RepID=A0A7I8WE39_9ANNE|nr:DgyrCDS14588 [Dimorphilus gyrociliatus]